MIYKTTLVKDDVTYTLIFDDEHLLALDNITDRVHEKYPNAIEDNEKGTLYTTQVLEYLDGKRKIFNLPINPQGTDFQMSVWRALLTIPFGTTVSYSYVAELVGDVKKVRAVANAIGKNPIMIVVPCHRVIGKDGKMHGFGGGIPLKRYLLNLENAL